ncbi:MAG: hypothetical protein ACK5TG_16020 [Planctomyces sp.]
MEFMMHVPSLKLAASRNLDQLVEEFTNSTGQPPTQVLLECFSQSGPNFQSKYFRPSVYSEVFKTFTKDAVDRGLQLWLSVDLGMPFAASAGIHQTDTLGDTSRRCCIHATGTQTILSHLSEEMTLALAGLPVTGMALPAQNLWPLGAQNNVIELNCVCRHCNRTDEKHGVDIGKYAYFPSPLNIALMDSGSGIAHISGITRDISGEELVRLSRSKQMLAAKQMQDLTHTQDESEHDAWSDLVEWAKELLNFIKIRAQLTEQSLGIIATNLKTVFSNISSALSVDGADYDWTSGMFADSVNGSKWLDEVWVPPNIDPEQYSQTRRHYCCTRGRYVVDQFANHLEMGETSFFGGSMASLRTEAACDQIQRLSGQLRAAMMATPGDFLTINDASGVTGCVVPLVSESAFPPDDSSAINEDKNLEALMSVLLRSVKQ